MGKVIEGMNPLSAKKSESSQCWAVQNG